MGWGDSCIKFVVISLNVLFSIIGLVFIGLSAAMLITMSNIKSETTEHTQNFGTVPIFLLVLGIIVFFISFLGCCGAIRESRCMLITYAVILLLVFVAQLTIGIYSLVHKSEFDGGITNIIQQLFNDSNPDSQKSFSAMEKFAGCCGVKGYEDYIKAGRSIPGACCSDQADCQLRPNIYWPKGCSEVIGSFFGKIGEGVGATTITFSVIEVVGAILALRLASRAK